MNKTNIIIIINILVSFPGLYLTFLRVRYMCGGRPGNEANRHVLSSSMMVTVPNLRVGLRMTLESVVVRLTKNTSFPSQSRSF